MKFKWRKWNKAIHRDLGYLFFAMTVIYSISGIAINHLHEWNPNYKITIQDVQLTGELNKSSITRERIKLFLDELDAGRYKKHYFPRTDQLKIFVDGGNVNIDLNTGYGYMERVDRRPILHAVNYLHYNPGRWWTLFSDIFAGALIILSLTGLFILRGKNGIKKRGAILTIAGIVLPILYLVIFY